MDDQDLAKELCAMHTQYAGTMNRLLEAYVSRGEDGVLVWMADKGKSTAAQIRETALLRHQQILERLGQQDAYELICIARRVLQTLQTMQQSSQ